VKSKEAFTKDPTIFATNNYSSNTNISTNPNLLKLSVPRFSQGEGSLVQVTASLHNQASAKQAGLLVYTTYDEGSKILYPSHAYQDPRLLPTLLVFAAIASFVGPYLYQLKIKRRRDFATRILFDFIHIYRRIDENPEDNEILVKPDMKGHALWKKYQERRAQWLKIDRKFFYLYDIFPDLHGLDPEVHKYKYLKMIEDGYKELDNRDKVLETGKKDAGYSARLKSANETVKTWCKNITTKIRWDVYGV
jgi:hypothetical protein